MQASPSKICDYLNGEKQNLIPVFQRPYSWKKDNWEALWQDIIQVYEEADRPKHFMGAIVSMPQSSMPVGVTKHLIIDGQQRLSTICLLLCAIRDYENTGERTKNRIQAYLTNQNFEDTADYLKFIPTNVDRDVYKRIVTKNALDTDVQHSMCEAYKEFLSKIKNYQKENSDKSPIDTDSLFDVITQNLLVVSINLDDTHDDPYLIFESLNAKGSDLTEADLVRNYIMMRFQHSDNQNGEQQKIYDDYWRPIEDAIKDKLTEFLRHYLHSYGNLVKRNTVYTSVKSSLLKNDKEDLLKELKKIKAYCKDYEFFIYPDRYKDLEIKKYLKMFESLGMTTCYPLLLRIFQSFNDGDANSEELKNSLRLIESFAIRRLVCGIPTKSLDQIFVSWCKNYKLPIDVTLWSLMLDGSGNRRWPSDEEFSDKIKTTSIYGQKVTLPFLHRIEESFAHKEPPQLETATIEHIMPQTLSSEWENYLGNNYKLIHGKYLHTFGNLTLSAYNAELHNHLFSAKRKLYADSNIQMNKFISVNSDWKDEQILNRADEISKIACKIWRGLDTSQEPLS